MSLLPPHAIRVASHSHSHSSTHSPLIRRALFGAAVLVSFVLVVLWQPVPLLPQRLDLERVDALRAVLRPPSGSSPGSGTAHRVKGASFDGPAFKVPHYVPARLREMVWPVLDVGETWGAEGVMMPEIEFLGLDGGVEGGERGIAWGAGKGAGMWAGGSGSGSRSGHGHGQGEQVIPRRLYQTWKTDVLGPRMMQGVSSWIEMNPEYEYFFLDDTEAYAYVQGYTGPDPSYFSLYTSPSASHPESGSPHMHMHSEQQNNTSRAIRTFVPKGCSHEALHPSPPHPPARASTYPLSPAELAALRLIYARTTIGASKADMLRLLLLYAHGGAYFDADTACVRPLREWVHPRATLVTAVGERGDPMQWGLVSAPGHPFWAQTLRLVIANYERVTGGGSGGGSKGSKGGVGAGAGAGAGDIGRDVEGFAGPPVLHTAVRQVLCGEGFNVAQGMQIMMGDEFLGRVRFKAEGVDEERRKQGHVHWVSEQKSHAKGET